MKKYFNFRQLTRYIKVLNELGAKSIILIIFKLYPNLIIIKQSKLRYFFLNASLPKVVQPKLRIPLSNIKNSRELYISYENLNTMNKSELWQNYLRNSISDVYTYLKSNELTPEQRQKWHSSGFFEIESYTFREQVNLRFITHYSPFDSYLNQACSTPGIFIQFLIFHKLPTTENLL